VQPIVSSKLSLDARLLGRKGRERVHQRRRQSIIRLQSHGLQLLPHLTHLGRIIALLDEGRDERSELRLLPAFLVGQLDVHEIKPLERVVLLDATVQMDAALLARVAEDGDVLVHDLQLVPVRGHFDVVDGDDCDDGEQSALGLPALRAATGVVVEDVARQGDFDGIARAVAMKLAAGEVVAALRQAIVDQRVEGWCHDELFGYWV